MDPPPPTSIKPDLPAAIDRLLVRCLRKVTEEPSKSRALLEEAIGTGTSDPTVLATIGETFEDLGDREQALHWIARTFEGGIERHRFENTPTLRDLVDDERYRRLAGRAGAAADRGGGASKEAP